MITTFFKGLRSTKPERVTSLEEILSGIQNGLWKEKVLKCHEDLSHKDRLPCFTPTGEFNHRSIAGLMNYNGIICLDIDHVTDPEILKQKASQLSYVHAAFVTPSGKGLKVIIKSKATVETYKSVEEEIAKAFMHDTGAIRDNRCKDIARIQFVSYDPDLYYNPQSKTF
jgi:hypothetical protein